eukprot:56743-Chlamydomonas_euryale.AAC.6
MLPCLVQDLIRVINPEIDDDNDEGVDANDLTEEQVAGIRVAIGTVRIRNCYRHLSTAGCCNVAATCEPVTPIAFVSSELQVVTCFVLVGFQ